MHGLVSVSGYLIGSQAADRAPLPPRPSCRGGTSSTSRPSAAGPATSSTGSEFARLIWQTASPKWDFDDATFDRSAASFDNPDHVDIVIHNYRWRLGLADGESRSTTRSRRGSRERRSITVPTITLEGDANGAPHPDPAAYRGEVRRARTSTGTITGGIGHNLPQEAPEAFAQAVIDVAE